MTKKELRAAMRRRNLGMDATDPAAAGALLPMARDAWLRCLQIGERPDLHGSVSGRGSHLAAHNLAVIEPAFGPCALENGTNGCAQVAAASAE